MLKSIENPEHASVSELLWEGFKEEAEWGWRVDEQIRSGIGGGGG